MDEKQRKYARTIRKMYGITSAEMAETLGVTVQTLLTIERGDKGTSKMNELFYLYNLGLCDIPDPLIKDRPYKKGTFTSEEYDKMLELIKDDF